ncbi:hypothetical protein FE783_31035 [Paenibacillus mesophilus]|uniref:hypothetical protein n=1 Tax=Paenibacillus mesophilus TaxID=2582849 RepID=UPI00110DA017|nr:hypothetical protein [Paenibacillus mesophilus]TMV44958.1 hypothetical protein FE783_31035 [Paenibacillus mesophilus]
MNKKWIAMGAGLGVGAIMLTVSGLTAMAGASGYDAWKSALKQTKTASSIAGTVQVAITDNGTKLAGVEAAFKKGDSGAASAEVKLDSGSAAQGLKVYLQDGKAVLKADNSDVYQVAEHGKEDGKGGPGWKRGSGDFKPDPAFAEGVERVFDALAGNLKDRVELETNADGSKRVSLHLSGNQVPVAVNAIGSFVIGNVAGGGHWDHEKQTSTGKESGAHALFTPDMKPNLPKLTQDIRIEEIKLDATIDKNNYFDDKSVEVRIAGKDAAGAAHSVTIKAAVDLNGVNATKADSVDLTGKKVEKIEREAGHGSPHERSRR